MGKWNAQGQDKEMAGWLAGWGEVKGTPPQHTHLPGEAELQKQGSALSQTALSGTPEERHLHWETTGDPQIACSRETSRYWRSGDKCTSDPVSLRCKCPRASVQMCPCVHVDVSFQVCMSTLVDSHGCWNMCASIRVCVCRAMCGQPSLCMWRASVDI